MERTLPHCGERKMAKNVRLPQLKLRETNNFPTYRVKNIEGLQPILERNMAIPFLSTFLSPPSAPRSESFLEFPADDSANRAMSGRPAAMAFSKPILYPLLMDGDLPGVIDVARTPPSALTAATKEFRSAITEERSVFSQSRARARPAPALQSAAGAPEENGAVPLHYWSGMGDFYEDGALEGQIGYSDFYEKYLKFCARRNYVGPKGCARKAFYKSPLISTGDASALPRPGVLGRKGRSPSSRSPPENMA